MTTPIKKSDNDSYEDYLNLIKNESALRALLDVVEEAALDVNIGSTDKQIVVKYVALVYSKRKKQNPTT
jgi:hypothetical protein